MSYRGALIYLLLGYFAKEKFLGERKSSPFIRRLPRSHFPASKQHQRNYPIPFVCYCSNFFFPSAQISRPFPNYLITHQITQFTNLRSIHHSSSFNIWVKGLIFFSRSQYLLSCQIRHLRCLYRRPTSSPRHRLDFQYSSFVSSYN